jgi:hypothetical protein
MSMQDWEDRDDEGREMFIRQLAGREPWDVRRRNGWLWFWLLVSLTVNLVQTVLLLAIDWLLGAGLPR